MSDTLTKQFTDAAEQQVKDSIDFHFDALVVKPNREINKLPESIFIQVFLPFFCGEKLITDEKDILVKWVSIAGAPTKEVQIIDDNGNDLFIVPPLMDSTIIDIKNEGQGQPFLSIISNYELHKNQLPVVGENYLKNSIDERMKTLTKDSTAHELNEKQWNNIFIRYNKIDGPNADESSDTNKLSDDEISYD